MKTLKQQLHQLCIEKLDASMASAQQAIDEARAAQKEETKSSAGDKFETTREMMTQEIEKGTALLSKLAEDRNRLLSILQNDSSESVQQGSMVITNLGKFYVGVSIGAVTMNGEKYQTISSFSPIGQLMISKKAGEKFELHEKEYVIKEIA
ncbi:MAG: 3-oxoacyl-ACP synthase [Bacteroidota bacterium]